MRAKDGIVAGTLTVAAALIGHGTSWLVGGGLLAAPDAVPIASETNGPSAPGPPDPCALIARAGFFDSSLRPTCEEVPPEPGGAGPDTETDVPCPSSLRLVGAVLPASSPPFAAIAEGGGPAMLYAVGMEVGAHEVRRIGRDEVVLAHEGGACRLAMFEREPSRAIAYEPPRGAPLASHATGPRAYRVARAEIDRTMGELMATLRALPHVGADGGVDGYRIVGVSRDGSAAALGIQNGDVITAVDEHPLTDVSAAVDALAILRTASHATLHVVRRGQPIAIEYEVD